MSLIQMGSGFSGASLTSSDTDSPIIGNLSELLSFSYVSVAYVLLGYFALRDVLS